MIYDSFWCHLLIHPKVSELENLFWSVPFNFQVPKVSQFINTYFFPVIHVFFSGFQISMITAKNKTQWINWDLYMNLILNWADLVDFKTKIEAVKVLGNSELWMILDTIVHSSGLGWAAGVYCCKSPLNGKDQNKFSNSLTFARMSKRRQKSSHKYHQTNNMVWVSFFQTRGRSPTTFTRFVFFWPPTPLRLFTFSMV